MIAPPNTFASILTCAPLIYSRFSFSVWTIWNGSSSVLGSGSSQWLSCLSIRHEMFPNPCIVRFVYQRFFVHGCACVCVCVWVNVFYEEEIVYAGDAFLMSLLSTKLMGSMQYCRMLRVYVLYIQYILATTNDRLYATGWLKLARPKKWQNVVEV